jgi:hypothetical protein
MTWPRIVTLTCAVLEAGWMAFDGIQALLTGHLVTPKSGTHAGELGPWRHLVEAAGIDPNGTGMRVVFAAYGLIWLGIAFGFALRKPWGWPAMVVAALGALWFLPVGTILSLVQLGLLFGFRNSLREPNTTRNPAHQP